jgi:hypothetical protein
MPTPSNHRHSDSACERHTSVVYKSGMVMCPRCLNWYRPNMGDARAVIAAGRFWDSRR